MNAHQVLDALAERRGEGATLSTIAINLVAFVEDASLLDWIAQRTDAIAQRHASRSIFLDASHGGEAHSVDSERKESEGTTTTRSEQIRMNVGDMGAAALGSVARELLVPNVQTVLLWAGPSLLDERFAALAELCNIVILDSSRAHTDAECLRQLARIADERLQPKIRDLAYMRLLPWQDLVALFFDDAKLAADLPALRAVQIDAGSEAEGYYFVGWLASRLAWQPCGKHAFCNAQGVQVAVGISRSGEPRRVQRVELRAPDRKFTAALDPDSRDLVCLTVTGAESRPARCAPLREVDVLSLIQRAMLATSSGDVFAETLRMVRTVLAQA